MRPCVFGRFVSIPLICAKPSSYIPEIYYSDKIYSIGEINMITNRELTSEEKESLAKEVRQFLLDNELWIDVRVYFNGKAFGTGDGKGNFSYNNPDKLIVLEDINPRDYFEYVSDDDVMSMSFEGDFYGCLNFTNEYGVDFDNRIQMEFDGILRKYGVYYELGHAWNLSCYYSWR